MAANPMRRVVSEKSGRRLFATAHDHEKQAGRFSRTLRDSRNV